MRINKILISFFLVCFALPQNNSGENLKLYKRAKSLEQAGLNEEAMALYEQLVQNDGKNNQYYNSFKRFLRNTGNQEKILDISLNYFEHNPKNPSAKFEWISALLANQQNNWKTEVNSLIEENYSDKNLMRQLLFSIYSAGLSHELKPISDKIRKLTKTESFLSRELGDIFIMRMDYATGINEYLLYLNHNSKDFNYISDKVMALPTEDYVVNQVRNVLENSTSNHSSLLLSNLEFREQNYLKAWEILKSQPNSGELQIEMGNDFIENNQFDFAEQIFREILTGTKDQKIIEKCIFNIGRTLELKSIKNANKLPISGFYRGNPFFTPPFISINNEAEVTICFAFPALTKKSIGLRKIPPPIPTAPERNPNTPPTKIETGIGILL